MVAVLKKAFGSIISAIAHCYFRYRDIHKLNNFDNFNYNMPKGRPLSLQVHFPKSFVFDRSRYLPLASAFTIFFIFNLLAS
jgi:hypothetical protein